MKKTDLVADCVRRSLSVPSPLAEKAIERAFKRIHRHEKIHRAACVLLPLASAILLLLFLVPKNIRPPKDDILSASTSAPFPSQELPETETVYVSKDDAYYHAYEKCAHAKGDTEPLMERVARLNSLYPCPVCCEFETKQPLTEAIAIGDILILRHEDEYLYVPELNSVFGYSFPHEYEGEEALIRLSEYLHGDRYSCFVNEAALNQTASFMAREPDILYLYPYETVPEINDFYKASLEYPNQTSLCTRYLGSSHYALYFTDFEISEAVGVYERVNGIELVYKTNDEKAVATCEFTDQTIEETEKFNVRFIDPESALYESEKGNLASFVYHTGNEYVLVIKERNADPYLLENVTLRIGENEFTVNGFMDVSGNLEALNEISAYYALILTEYEANSIKNGAEISLDHLNFPTIADKSPFRYIPVQYGTGSYGVMDKTGEFVIAPEYENAWSYQDLSGLYAKNVTGPIVLKDYAGTIYLYDGETLDQIAWYSMDGANSVDYAFPRSTRNSFNILSPGIYEISRDEGVYLLNRKGEVMMSFLYDETGNFENSLYYSATFLHEAAGYPDCLVLFEQKGSYVPDRMWIADLSGNRLSRDFDRLIPLIWTENRAIFINVTYDRKAAEKNSYLPYYEKGLAFSGYEKDNSFRLGLVDQNGNDIAECKYISLEIVGNQIYLTRENGEQDIINTAE